MDTFRSPLMDDYYDGQEHPSSHGQRFSSYKSNRKNRDRGTSYAAHSQHPHTEHSGSNRASQNHPNYSDRYRPPSYPRELRELCGPKECKLCGVEVNAPVVSIMHYGGKQHTKKVKNYLAMWAQRTGCPVPDIDESSRLTLGSTFSAYCEVCDRKLLSANDKILHFSSKTHRKNELNPANAKKKKMIKLDYSDDRFDIGTSFSSSSKKVIKMENKDDKNTANLDFSCDTCNVKTISQDQLDAHLSGKKHKEKLAKKESTVPKPGRRYSCQICNVSLDTRTLYNLHCDGKRHMKNLSKLEMQDGQDYCEQCDVKFTSFDHYKMHINGQRHEKRCNRLSSEAALRNVKERQLSVICKDCPYVGNIDHHVCDRSLEKKRRENPDSKFVCNVCYHMIFDTEDELTEHNQSERHLICTLNSEDGDRVIETIKHFYCFLCKKQYQNNKDFYDHLFEEKHTNLTKDDNLENKTDLFHCSACNIMMNGKIATEHLKSISHLKQAISKDTMSFLQKLVAKPLETNIFQCSNCDVTLNSFVKYSDHLLGDYHVSKIIEEKFKEN